MERGGHFEEMEEGSPTPCDRKAVLWRWPERKPEKCGQGPNHAAPGAVGVLLHSTPRLLLCIPTSVSSDLSHAESCQQDQGLPPKSRLPGDHSLQSCSFTEFMSQFLHGKILNVIFPQNTCLSLNHNRRLKRRAIILLHLVSSFSFVAWAP